MPDDAGAIALLLTARTLGLRHGIDWDHLAAITDITSTTSAAEAAEVEHEEAHESSHGHDHEHGGDEELRTHDVEPDAHEPHDPHTPVRHHSFLQMERQPVILGSLYALGHALVVALIGTIALVIGARLPDWVDPLMGRVVGLTLLLLGVWVFVSLYNYVRHGTAFRMRSRWMLVFDGVRYGWRRFQGWLHGHQHVEPLEMSSYGPRTSFGVGMIHGVGAETGSQVLLIAAVGGASSAGLGIPMLFAFVAGLLVSNFGIVILTSTGFVASQTRERIYVAVGLVAGLFSLTLGLIYVFGMDAIIPEMDSILPF